MRFLLILGTLFVVLLFARPKTAKLDIGVQTGKMVKALVKANWVIQKIVTSEIEAAQYYIKNTIVGRLNGTAENMDVGELKEKIKKELITMLDVAKECGNTGGLAWLANRALRLTEHYREVHMRSNILEICSLRSNQNNNKTCLNMLTRHEKAIKSIEGNVMQAVDRIGKIFDSTMKCLHFRYDSLMKTIANKRF